MLNKHLILSSSIYHIKVNIYLLKHIILVLIELKSLIILCKSYNSEKKT